MIKKKKKISASIIILTTNALAMTKEQLLDVAKLEVDNLDCECMIVDNGSPDGTEEALKDYKLPNMKYKFIQSGANLGFAGGNNVGIKDALKRKIDYIILMNNDLILQKDIVLKLVSFIDKNPKVGVASPKMYFAKGYEFHTDKYKTSEKGNVLWYAGGIIDKENVYTTHRGVDEVDHGQYNKIEETDVANGACVIIRREVFEKIGMLDASFFLYWEDADFSARAERAGYKVIYYPDTWMWHKVSASTGGSGSPTNDYFLIRNRFYYSMRYSKLRTKFAVLRDTVRNIFTGRIWQRWGAIDALLGRKGMGQWKYR
ncbi:MAG: glycosyltransferase family 2 protein [Patescibacteria group bacterium]